MLLGAAACSGDDDDASEPADAAEQPQGEPIKVMSIGEFDSPSTGFSDPYSEAGLTARVEAINASGGIGGRPVELSVCNAAGDVNAAARCARDAVEQDVAAITHLFVQPQSEVEVFPILEAAGIPVIGSAVLGSESGTSPISFAFALPLGAAFALPGVAAAAGATKVSVIEPGDSPFPEEISEVIVSQGAEHAGIESAGVVRTTPGATDLAPFVSSAVDDDVDAVLVNLTGDALASAIRLLKDRGFEGEIVTVGLTEGVRDALGDDAEGVLTVGVTSGPTADTEGAAMFAEDMEALDTDVQLNETALLAWMDMWTFERVAGELEVVEASTVLEGLNNLTDFDMGGIIPPITTTEPGTIDDYFEVPGFPPPTRLFNKSVTYKVIEDGTEQWLDDKFHNPYTSEDVPA